MATARYDLFVSYAHADDEVPSGASQGWVTTLAEELKKVLRRRIGGSGATVWMDHQLAANANVSEALLETLRSSQMLLLVMSPGYQRSSWCQRELGNFVAQSAARKSKDNVFIVETEPIARESWHESLQSLTAIRFWDKGFKDKAPRLLGFPIPKADEDNPYWRNVNELAHLIAEFLRRSSAEPLPPSKPAVLLAETTEDLLDRRESVVAFLRQQEYEVLPVADYPRDSEAAYVDALTRDLSRVRAFVQLLGPYEGRRPLGGDTSFVALQARQAIRARDQGGVRILQWRAPEVELERLASAAYRELVTSRYAQAGGLEEFKQQLLKALAPEAPPAEERRPARELTAAADLLIYVSADQVDRTVGYRAGDSLEALDVTALLSTDPAPEQRPEDIRRALKDQLESCDGVLIVYGETPGTWVQSQFAFARQVLARKKRGVWGALLDVAAPERPPAPVRSPSLITLDCRQGLDPGKLTRFVETLRANGGAAHA
jgi:hypothetical protein